MNQYNYLTDEFICHKLGICVSDKNLQSLAHQVWELGEFYQGQAIYNSNYIVVDGAAQATFESSDVFSYAGINFAFGRNKTQEFFATKKRGIVWVILRGQGKRPWTALAWLGDRVRRLNSATCRKDGSLEPAPLSGEYIENFPRELLESLAVYINSGTNPFTI